MKLKGIIIQSVVVLLSIGIFITLALAPKTYSDDKVKDQKVKDTKNNIQEQITEIKNEMDKKDLVIINSFESSLNTAKGTDKFQWLDSIIGFYDHLMRPAVSAIYAKEKAEMSGKIEDMVVAGERFLGVAQFLKAEDKPWAYDEAKAAFEKVLEREPDNADAKINLGICVVETNPGNPMEGIGLIREVLQKEPNNLRAVLQLGHFSVLSGQLSKAIERYEQALEIDPDFHETYFFLGDTYAKMGDMVNAEKYLLIYRGYLEGDEVKQQLDTYLEDLKNSVKH